MPFFAHIAANRNYREKGHYLYDEFQDILAMYFQGEELETFIVSASGVEKAHV